MPFEFATATRILFGPGTLQKAGPSLAEFGQRALVVTGRSAPRAQPLLALLEKQNIQTELFCVPGEPTIETVVRGTAAAREHASEFVIGFGGGSALDAGKAIAAMLTNPGELLEYLEIIGQAKPLAQLAAPFVAIPTTAGTGSEVTRNAVLGSPSHQLKVSLRSPGMLARLAVVDPELTYDLPAAITARTGLDALTQLIEPFVSCRANPLADALCREAIPRVARSLRKACTEPQDKAAREDMSLASLFGGLALSNAGLGAVHGLAGPLGGMFPAPHGALCAALLPHAMAINSRALSERQPQGAALARYQEVARLLTHNPRASVASAITWLKDLNSELRIPPLRAYGVTTAHATELVEKAANASSMKANPIVLTRSELGDLLTAAI